MTRWGMVIDLDRCTGCQSCVIACKAENNIPFVGPAETRKGRDISWMEVITEIHREGETTRASFTPRPCFHCEAAPCTKVCPVHATYLTEDGFVAQIFERCIGCRFCMAACPYTAKYFNWFEYEVPNLMALGRNPDVSVRRDGVVEKCTFCHHRQLRAEDRAAAEGRRMAPHEFTTACQDTCPSGAILFGDLDDEGSEVARAARSNRAFRLLEELGTKPKVYYLKEENIAGS